MLTITESLSGFSRWMNRPSAKVHVYTHTLAKELNPVPPFYRIRRVYRDAEVIAFRWRLAQWLKARRYAGRITLPTYSESVGRYDCEETPNHQTK